MPVISAERSLHQLDIAIGLRVLITGLLGQQMHRMVGRPVRIPGLLLGLVMGFLASGSAANADRLSEDLLLSEARKNQDARTELRRIEEKALADAEAGRQDGQLVLHLRSGNTRILADRQECEDPDQETKCERYSLVTHARTRNLFVVAKLEYEGLDAFLIDDATGKETSLPAFPIFSPSGEHLLVFVENDGVLGFVVQIWRREAGKFILDWSGSPHSGGVYVTYKLLRWRSEDVIDAEAEISDGPKPDHSRKFTVRRIAGRWKLAIH